MHFRLFLNFLLAFFLLSACTPSSEHEVACRATKVSDSPMLPAASAAGCLINFSEHTLLVEHRLTGRLDIPGGGQQAGETLACTAHRETFEETGFNVLVGAPVAQTTNGMVIFACTLDNVVDVAHFPRPVPDFADVEVRQLNLVNLFDIDPPALRFAQDMIPFRDAMTRTPSSTPLFNEPQ